MRKMYWSLRHKFCKKGVVTLLLFILFLAGAIQPDKRILGGLLLLFILLLVGSSLKTGNDSSNTVFSKETVEKKNSALVTFAPDPNDPYPACAKALQEDNLHKDVLAVLQPWTLKPDNQSKDLVESIRLVFTCLERQERLSELDGYLEELAKVHHSQWRVLFVLAELGNRVPFGALRNQIFYRGDYNGARVFSRQRDRVRSIQWMLRAAPLLEKEFENKLASNNEFTRFYEAFASLFSYNEFWKYQLKTDLTILPDYEEEMDRFSSRANYAPVDSEGNPIYYPLPKDFQSAKNDGQRWRWLVEKGASAENDGTMPSQKAQGLLIRASFCNSQFGVETLRGYNYFFPTNDSARSTTEETAALWELSTLQDSETIARLASGINRFSLPDEFNPIKLYQQVVDLPESSDDQRQTALSALAEIYMNRRQYTRAIAYYQKLSERFNTYNKNLENPHKKQIEQIVNPWGRFEVVQATAYQTPVDLRWKFRNGRSATFTVRPIKIPALLKDIKEYIQSFDKVANKIPERGRIEIERIGYQLVHDSKMSRKYLGETIAKWTVALTPEEGHQDQIVPIDFPIKKGGAYFVEGTMKDGNTDTVIVWIHDTAIVEKRLGEQYLYFVADAKTGEPIAEQNLDFFGFGQFRKKSRFQKALRMSSPIFETKTMSRTTDSNGQIRVHSSDFLSATGGNYQWLISLSNDSSDEPRFAFYGINNFWYGTPYNPPHKEIRAFIMTDRPVYRPEQNLEFKFWVGSAKYDQPDSHEWAGKKVSFKFCDPMGNTILEKNITLDNCGSYASTFPISKDAKLGRWSVWVSALNNKTVIGQGYFLVEEYRKPEFEVTVEGPDKPIGLGKTFPIKISAKYYFGAPVTKGKVHYTVTRVTARSEQYPVRPWDWFYGNGYSWFMPNSDWYPGWKHWGCLAPVPFWLPPRTTTPEIITDSEAELNQDGTVTIAIDTASAKTLFPNDDQQYQIRAEVVDQSRRTIIGVGSVFASRTPFRVTTSLDRGFFQPKDQLTAHFLAHRIDGKPVAGNAVIKVFKIQYVIDSKKPDKIEPKETEIFVKRLTIGSNGSTSLSLSAGEPGQYRLSCSMTDAEGNTQEGATLFTVHGSKMSPKENDFRFNQLELITEKAEYAPGENARLLVNTDQTDSTVLLFLRTENGLASDVQTLHLKGRSEIVDFKINVADMPNIFVEAITIANGRCYNSLKEIIVPPENRILDLTIQPTKEKYRPGEKAKADLIVTDSKGKPVVGQLAVAIYDKSLEYISGGSLVGKIKEEFWKWRRHSIASCRSNLEHLFRNVSIGDEMQNLGIFDSLTPTAQMSALFSGGTRRELKMVAKSSDQMNANVVREMNDGNTQSLSTLVDGDAGQMEEVPMAQPGTTESNLLTGLVEPSVRKNFKDTALWVSTLETDPNGRASIELEMPENLTTWKISAWTFAPGSRVGEGSTEVLTGKDLILRLQKPRFLIQNDEILLTANVHNYLSQEKDVQVALEFPSEPEEPVCLNMLDRDPIRKVRIVPGGEARIDWKVNALRSGTAKVRMKALTDEESDGVEETFPVHVHGILKQEAVSGMIAAGSEDRLAKVVLNVPKERRPEDSELTVRFSPTLAGALFDALPYLIEYPYGCTEQTLNRFLPLLLVQKTLIDFGIDLSELREKRTNLNTQEIGSPDERTRQWKKKTPFETESKDFVFDRKKVRNMANEGAFRLLQMQCGDGGWGWFSGYGEQSSAELTARVLHGLKLALDNDIKVDDGVMQRGKNWLVNYLRTQAILLRHGQTWDIKRKTESPDQWKQKPDELDAFVFNVLTEFDLHSSIKTIEFVSNEADFVKQLENSSTLMSFMKDNLWEHRAQLSPYAESLFGLALLNEGLDRNREQIERIVLMLSQYQKEDPENQTAWLALGASGQYWWRWYGNDIETQAHYLLLMTRLDPRNPTSPKLVKYLLNNRKNATWWNSTRDTAYCIEAFAEYLKETNELEANTNVEVLVNDRVRKSVTITSDNLFLLDNTLVLSGKEITDGPCSITIRQTGNGPLYYNVYLKNFTLEDRIQKTGLEVKIDRKYYLLEKEKDATQSVAGNLGQVTTQKIEKFKKIPIEDLSQIKSGALVEVELLLESKNDYDSILIEDRKPAGFEPVDLRSGYTGNDLHAYVEFREDRVAFFVTQLAQGKSHVSYRLRAEQPGQFSALPATIYGMYAPELRGNADEFKVRVTD